MKFTIGTTAAKAAALSYPKVTRKPYNGTAGSVAALFSPSFLSWIPARRRAWRQMLGILVLVAALGALSSCGGGGSGGGGGGGGSSDPGTTAGTYTFTVQATGSPTVTPAVSTTFIITVN